MRVLYVINSFEQGGAEQSLVEVTPSLVDRGVELTVVALMSGTGVEEALNGAGARTVDLSGDGNWLKRARSTRALCHDLQPDLLHSTLFQADVLSRAIGPMQRTRVVTTLANNMYGPEHVRNPASRSWQVRAAHVADAGTSWLTRRFHAVSEVVAQTMAPRLLVPKSKIDVVWRGRDRARLGVRSADRRAAARAGLGLQDDDIMLLALGRHERQKALDVAITAMADVRKTLPRAKLLVAGRDGSQTADLKAQVANMGLDEAVQFLGHRKDVPDLLVAADMLVFPSRWEGLPGSVLEAMALGTPIVASALPNTLEAATDQCARLVPIDDAPALAAAIAQTIRDEEATAAQVAAGIARFDRHFSVGSAADGMVSFYERALS